MNRAERRRLARTALPERIDRMRAEAARLRAVSRAGALCEVGLTHRHAALACDVVHVGGPDGDMHDAADLLAACPPCKRRWPTSHLAWSQRPST